MKILWLTNIPLPTISEEMNLPTLNVGGWLIGLSNDLKYNDDIELNICFPVDNIPNIITKEKEKIAYHAIPRKIADPTKYDNEIENNFSKLLENIDPDVVHIWGTEFPHSLAMVNACKGRKVIISIQGLCSIYATHYYANLPNEVIKRFTIRDLIKQDNIAIQKRKFEKRGAFEIEAIKNVNHIIGRTNWDKACTSQINPNANYYFCNETLRDEFYNHSWDIEKCEKFSIFLSQGEYPIKGLHYFLEALPLIIKQYPRVHLYIAGTNISKSDSLKDKFRLSSYGKHIRDLIRSNHLENHITFTGGLNEKQMCDRYINSHLFICPSSIENSPNSLGEAMILGVPSIASDVGGVTDMLRNKEEGFVYQTDAPYMLAYYVCKLFGDDDLAGKLSINAKRHANVTHNKVDNKNRIIEIYKEVLNKS